MKSNIFVVVAIPIIFTILLFCLIYFLFEIQVFFERVTSKTCYVYISTYFVTKVKDGYRADIETTRKLRTFNSHKDMKNCNKNEVRWIGDKDGIVAMKKLIQTEVS